MKNASTTNIRIGFYIDSFQSIYSCCRGLFVGAYDSSEVLSDSNHVVFKDPALLCVDSFLLPIEPVDIDSISEEEKKLHYTFWGVIAVGVNPIKTQKANQVKEESEVKVVSELAFRSVSAAFFVDSNWKRINNIKTPKVLVVRNIKKGLEIKMIEKLKSAIDAGDNLIPALSTFVAALKQVDFTQADTLVKQTLAEAPAQTATEKVVVYPSDLFKELGLKRLVPAKGGVSAVPESFIIGQANERGGLALGLQTVASMLLELHSSHIDTQPAEELCLNHNTTYNPTLLTVAVHCANTADGLLVRLEDGLSGRAKDAIAVGLRHSVNNTKALLQHIADYEIFKPAIKFETKAELTKLISTLIEDMKVVSKYSNILNGSAG